MKREDFKAHINYETVAKLFFDIADERYPGSDKITQLAAKVTDPIQTTPWESIMVKIAVLTIMRDMCKEVSPTRLYRSLQHRDDVFMAIIEALENLEDELEILEEEALSEQEQEPSQS